MKNLYVYIAGGMRIQVTEFVSEIENGADGSASTVDYKSLFANHCCTK
jgi:hypothetical protein